MDLKSLITHKKVRLLLAVAMAVLIGVLGAKPAWYALTDATFYWKDRTETEIRVKTFAEENGLHFVQYPQSLVELLERNPETADFVLNYPLREDPEEIELSGYDRTSVPLFLQWDSQWGYEEYGSDFLAVTGCGPTCLAMAGFYLTGSQNMNPRDIAVFAEKNGYYVRGEGSSWTLISQGSTRLGLTAEELPLVKSKMVKALEEGRPVILSLRAGDFTTSGHYIVLTGVEEGQFRVNDPNSVENSQKLWSYEQLEGQIRNIWAIGL